MSIRKISSSMKSTSFCSFLLSLKAILQTLSRLFPPTFSLRIIRTSRRTSRASAASSRGKTVLSTRVRICVRRTDFASRPVDVDRESIAICNSLAASSCSADDPLAIFLQQTLPLYIDGSPWKFIKNYLFANCYLLNSQKMIEKFQLLTIIMK